MLALMTEAKGLKMPTLNVKEQVRSQDAEMARLRSALATANKENGEVDADREIIQQKACDDMYNMHKADFNHL